MLPLYKLKTLPRSQRLRKIASLAKNAELKVISTGEFSRGEAEYFASLVGFLEQSENFACPVPEELKTAGMIFAAESSSAAEIRRALNTLHFILQTETGRCQADWDFLEASGVLDSSKRKPFPGVHVYLDDIRSPFNVGAIFRAAESFGAEKIWLSPLCADPRHKRALRTAMGCVDVLPWERLAAGTLAPGPFFALETGGVLLDDFTFPSRGTLIAGSEELGVSPRALEAADASLGRVTIPTRGTKGSLNVSVAFGIVMQAWAAALRKMHVI